MRLALAQINTVVGDLDGNRDRILARIEEARAAEADVLLLPELAPELVRKLASGRYDALAGRYLHAEHDDVDELLGRIDAIRDGDLNAIRLQRG